MTPVITISVSAMFGTINTVRALQIRRVILCAFKQVMPRTNSTNNNKAAAAT